MVHVTSYPGLGYEPYGHYSRPGVYTAPGAGMPVAWSNYSPQPPQPIAQAPPRKLPWYLSFAKEALKIGVIVGATIALGPVGGIIAAAVCSGADQLLTKGKIDIGNLLIDTAMGAIPGGFGNLAFKGGAALAQRFGLAAVKQAGEAAVAQATKSLMKETLKVAAKGAIDGAAMGYLGGAVNHAYDSYKETGRLDLAGAHAAGTEGMVAGAIGGAVLGGGMHYGIRRYQMRAAARQSTQPGASPLHPAGTTPPRTPEGAEVDSLVRKCSHEGTAPKPAQASAPQPGGQKTPTVDADSAVSQAGTKKRRLVSTTEQTQTQGGRRPRRFKVAVLDDFKTKDVRLDSGWDITHTIINPAHTPPKVTHTTHGHGAEGVLRAYAPKNTRIHRYQIDGNNHVQVRRALKRLAKDLERGRKIDAVNLSYAAEINYTDLYIRSGLRLDARNVAQPQNIKAIRNWLRTSKDPDIIQMRRLIASIERISSKHKVPVFTGAGNKGDDCFNLFLVAKGRVRSVGATDALGSPLTFTPTHGRVKTQAQGVYTVTSVVQDRKLLGFDLRGNGQVHLRHRRGVQARSPEAALRRWANQEHGGMIGQPAKDHMMKLSDMNDALVYMQQRQQLAQQGQLSQLSAQDTARFNRLLLPDGGGFRTITGIPVGVNRQGQVRLRTRDMFDFDNSGRRGGIGFISGSSFASPRALARYLRWLRRQGTTT